MQITLPEDVERSLVTYATQNVGATDGCAFDLRSADRIYLEHAPILRRIAIRKFKVPPEDAKGLVHDVFISYLGNPAAVHTSIRGYLISAICNASKNYWRSRRSENRVFSADDEAAVDSAAVPDDLFEGLSQHLVVGAILAKLDSGCREVLRRYYLNGEDTATIAENLNMTPANVNYRVHVCRKRARPIYAELSGKR